MKNIIKIFRDDLKDIFTNTSALIVLLGLAILPSLYAWFNIKASWDPYGNTSNISVAVVNNDNGGNLLDKEINIGDKLIKELKNNNSLGWEFVNSEKANKGVQTGKYYASIEIPEDFSKNILSVLSNKVEKAKINYTVNEKINAIAPKITDKGASTVQLKVNQTVVKTAGEAVFEVLNEVGISLEKNLPALSRIENSLVEVQDKFKQVNKILNTATDASAQITDISKLLQKEIPNIEDTIENSIGLSGAVKNFLNNSKTSVNDIAPVVKNDLQIINSISLSAIGNIQGLIDLINENYENAPQIIDGLTSKIDSLSSETTNLIKVLKKLDKITPGSSLKNTIEMMETINSKLVSAKSILNEIKNQINNGQKPSLDKLNALLSVVKDIKYITENILNDYEGKILTPINNILDKGMNISTDVSTLLQKAEDKLPKVDMILDTALDLSKDADKTIKYAKEKVPEAEKILDKLVTALSKVNNSDDMDELVAFLKNDIETHSDFLKQPVALDTKTLYPMKNYGSAMTPFYTVLSLWVGVVLLTSLLSTEVDGEYKPHEVYFGRGLTFLLIALVQGLIVSIGDIMILGVSVTNPILFVTISLLISTIFTFIVYSLVSVFGNIGKSLAVILLVIQVAGSGGTFPIQVTPEFFQFVNPLLPFTYAISALRETVAGIYMPNLQKDILVLLAFLVVSVILNVILKGPLNKLLSKFAKKLSKCRVIGH